MSYSVEAIEFSSDPRAGIFKRKVGRSLKDVAQWFYETGAVVVRVKPKQLSAMSPWLFVTLPANQKKKGRVLVLAGHLGLYAIPYIYQEREFVRVCMWSPWGRHPLGLRSQYIVIERPTPGAMVAHLTSAAKGSDILVAVKRSVNHFDLSEGTEFAYFLLDPDLNDVIRDIERTRTVDLAIWKALAERNLQGEIEYKEITISENLT